MRPRAWGNARSTLVTYPYLMKHNSLHLHQFVCAGKRCLNAVTVQFTRARHQVVIIRDAHVVTLAGKCTAQPVVGKNRFDNMVCQVTVPLSDWKSAYGWTGDEKCKETKTHSSKVFHYVFNVALVCAVQLRFTLLLHNGAFYFQQEYSKCACFVGWKFSKREIFVIQNWYNVNDSQATDILARINSTISIKLSPRKNNRE